MKTATKPAQTASSRSIVQPKGCISFTDEELVLITESLRVAISACADNAAALEELWPTSPLIERLRMWAEHMQDVRARIDAS